MSHRDSFGPSFHSTLFGRFGFLMVLYKFSVFKELSKDKGSKFNIQSKDTV